MLKNIIFINIAGVSLRDYLNNIFFNLYIAEQPLMKMCKYINERSRML